MRFVGAAVISSPRSQVSERWAIERKRLNRMLRRADPGRARSGSSRSAQPNFAAVRRRHDAMRGRLD